MPTNETCFDVDLRTTTTTKVVHRITLTWEDLLQMFEDQGVDTSSVKAIHFFKRTYGGIFKFDDITSINDLYFEVDKITTEVVE